MSAERALYQHVDPAAEAAADARAEADVAAGRLVDHAAVAAWLARWGTADEVPARAEWLA
jgi:predicted transcriptional regulator